MARYQQFNSIQEMQEYFMKHQQEFAQKVQMAGTPVAKPEPTMAERILIPNEPPKTENKTVLSDPGTLQVVTPLQSKENSPEAKELAEKIAKQHAKLLELEKQPRKNKNSITAAKSALTRLMNKHAAIIV